MTLLRPVSGNACEVVGRPEHDTDERAEQQGPKPSDLMYLSEPERHEHEPGVSGSQRPEHGNGGEGQVEAEWVREDPPGHDVPVPATEAAEMVEAGEGER